MCSGWVPQRAGILPTAVPILLFRGLEVAAPLLHPRRCPERFNQINTLADLKKLKAAQGGGLGRQQDPGTGGIPTYARALQQPVSPMNDDGDKLDFPRGLVEIFSPNAASWRHNIPTW